MGATFQKQPCGCYLAPEKLIPCDEHKGLSATMARAAGMGSAQKESALDPDEVKGLVESVRDGQTA